MVYGMVGCLLLGLGYTLTREPRMRLTHFEHPKVQTFQETNLPTTIISTSIVSPTTPPAPTSTHEIVKQEPTPASPLDEPILGPASHPFQLYYPGIPRNATHINRLKPAPHNTPPPNRTRTPLFISFTRNNEMLLQCILSYLAAGWPPTDILIIDNSGTMDANPLSQLSPSNPFYLDYRTLREVYGVSVLQTPTLLSFSQLQNFFLRTAMAAGWEYYFWGHMDVVVLSDESLTPYKSFYARVLDVLESVMPSNTTNPQTPAWALRFFNYDYLTLINVPAMQEIGLWDTFIPYYASDCDFYSRVHLSGLDTSASIQASAGKIYDVASVVPSLESKLFPQPPPQTTELNGKAYQALAWELESLQRFKQSDQATHRNSWQGEKKGGGGERWTYDVEGFDRAWWVMAGAGQSIYEKKWGTRECNFWRLEGRDWLGGMWKDHKTEG